jgi:chemotaxis protein CheZ
MMAQDFQDLTGQVIKKVMELAYGIEQQLVQLLVDYAPPEIRREAGSGLLNGPQIHPTGNPDVVSSQGQVDDLLESLGF